MPRDPDPLFQLWSLVLHRLLSRWNPPRWEIHVDHGVPNSEPGFGDRLWPLVLTALLTLLVYWVVQLVLVPKSERKKRIEDRWEQDARELGKLVVFDLQVLLGRMRSQLRLERTIVDISTVTNEATARRAEALVTCRNEQGDLETELRSLDQQLKWLVERLAAHDPGGQKYLNLKMRQLAAPIVGLPSILGQYRTNDDDVPSVDRIQAADEQSKEELEKFTALATELIDGGRTRTTPRRRDVISTIKKAVCHPIETLRRNN